MKLHATAALLAAALALAAAGGAAQAQPSNQEIHETLANTKIDRARILISQKKYDEARDVLIDVLLDGSLSDETRGRAFYQKGNAGMSSSDYKNAKKDYQSVLQLPGASAGLKKAAQSGFEFAESFEKLRSR
jgi:predicted negative regulator of RcsB-dependent stress response